MSILKKRTRNKVINREGKIPLSAYYKTREIDAIIVTHTPTIAAACHQRVFRSYILLVHW